MRKADRDELKGKLIAIKTMIPMSPYAQFTSMVMPPVELALQTVEELERNDVELIAIRDELKALGQAQLAKRVGALVAK